LALDTPTVERLRLLAERQLRGLAVRWQRGGV
jgi:hypothetical protein